MKRDKDKKIIFRRIRGRIVPIAIGAGLASAGSNLTKKGYADVKGVKTVYHGTSKAAYSSIKKSGLKANTKSKTFSGGASVSDNVFVSSNKFKTKSFSRFSEYASKHGPFNLVNKGDSAKESIKKIFKKEAIGLLYPKGKVLSMDFPRKTWKKKFTEDPENIALKKHFKMINSEMPKNIKAIIKGRYASKTNVSARRIKQTQSFSKRAGISFARIKRTKKKIPSLFNRGIKRMGVGAGLIVAGAFIGTRDLDEKK